MEVGLTSSVHTGLKPRVSLVVLPAGGGGVSLFNYPLVLGGGAAAGGLAP